MSESRNYEEINTVANIGIIVLNEARENIAHII
jgi:hypothetical protein